MITSGRGPRRGVTLIEMMVVIGVLGILLGLCAVTIQLLLRLSSDAQARRGASAAVGRLAEQFRDDVHVCKDLAIRPPSGLRLQVDPRASIDYEVKAGRVTRVETTGAQATRRESYELGKHVTALFERREEGPARFAVLVIHRDGKAGATDPPRPMEVLAQIGKDRPGTSRPEGGPPR